jgi:hypothetical protein
MNKSYKLIILYVIVVIISYTILAGSIVGNSMGFISIVGLIIEIINILRNKESK